MSERIAKIDSFVAEDASGNRHIIDVYQRLVSVATRLNSNAEMLGVKELFCGEQRVNYIGKGKYRVAVSGTELTSSDTNCV